MNKLFLMFAGTLAIPGCSEPGARPSGSVPKASVQTPLQTEAKNNVAAAERPTADVAVAEGAPERASGEFGSAVANAHPEQVKAMLAAAQKTWEATKASYDVGTSTLASLHHWSRQLMLTERALAKNQEQDLAALLGYWKRNKQTYLKVRALYNAGSHGGEIERFGEASYYLAEAELLLKAAGGTVPDNLD